MDDLGGFDAESKVCQECGTLRPLSSYRDNPRRLDGRTTNCADCLNRIRREYRAGIRRVRPPSGAKYAALSDDDPMVAGRTRTCRSCNIDRPLTMFLRNTGSKLGRLWACRPCHADMLERRRDSSRERQREARRVRKYGASVASLRLLFDSQGGACGICRTQLDYHAKSTHVDHCHVSGVIRGILCQACNLGLGKFFDDKDRLQAAIAYLDRSDT